MNECKKNKSILNRWIKDQRGVAIMLVLGAITLLSALAVDFGRESQVNLRMAMNERNNLQAEYLARSSINMLRLLMVKERALKNTITQLSGGAIDPKVPLCKQFPLSTELLRGVFSTISGSGQKPDESDETPEVETAAANKVVTQFERAAAESFLSFSGDFDAECEDESSKINLNRFATLQSDQQTLGGLNAYDQYKQLITQFLSRREVKALFIGDESEQEQKIEDAVRNIADWIDTDTQINERPGVRSGDERSIYSDREDGFELRNGRMATLDEAYLIEGVTDSWFAPISSYFTIYGGDKVNVCTAEPAIVEALIRSYAANNERIPSIGEEDHELIDSVVEGVATLCADPQVSAQQITQTVESLLTRQGAASDGFYTAPPANGGAPVTPGAGGGFADLITIESGPFRLIATGRVGTANHQNSVRIDMLLDTSDQDPKKWRTLYWHIQ